MKIYLRISVQSSKVAIIGALSALLLLSGVGGLSADTLINFDSVDATGGWVDATSYLASFGITLSNVSTPGSVYIQDETFNGGSSYATAASSPNYLAQWVSGSHLQSYTLNFSAPLQSLSFVSCAIGSSSSVAGWSATAYDSSNTQVDSASSSGGNGPAQTWTLSGANPIAYLTITADGGGVAGIPSPPLDNFDLVEAVPEPGTAWVGIAVLLAAFFWRRRVRSAQA